MSWLDKFLPGLAGASEPGQLSLDLGDTSGGLNPRKILSRSGLKTYSPGPVNRLAMGDDFLNAASKIGKGSQYMQGVKGVAGKAVPLFIALDAATELADEKDPFGKNLAEGLGKAGGTIGGAWGGGAIAGALTGAKLGATTGPLAGAAVPIGAILGAILMSDAGKELAGGAYKIINPRGELEYAKKQIQKQAEIQKEIDSVNREISRDRARDQQRLAFETAILNAAMGR